MPANPVLMNGLAIGSVYTTEPGDADLNTVLVTVRLEEEVNIPSNSLGVINSTLLGSSSLEIIKGTATTHLNPGDTLLTKPASGFLGDVMSKLEPTQNKLDAAIISADSVLGKINMVLNDKARGDLQQTLANLNQLSANLTQTTVSLNAMLNAQTGSVSKTFKNLQDFSEALNAVQGKLPVIASNLETTSKNLSQLDLDKTLRTVNETVASLQELVNKASSTNGTLGALINEKKLYNNLDNTINSLNLLMQDLRLNPKRYVNISVFGKKNKSEPLMKPLITDSITGEQKQ